MSCEKFLQNERKAERKKGRKGRQGERKKKKEREGRKEEKERRQGREEKESRKIPWKQILFFPFILPMRNLIRNTFSLLTQNRLQASSGFVEGDLKKKSYSLLECKVTTLIFPKLEQRKEKY